jgi:hypothetical protein
MTTTEKANIGGYSFTLEKEAYAMLEKYLSDIEKAYEADPFSKEIVSDIEVRIAELLLEKCGKDKVIGISDTQGVCGRIGSPEDLKMEEKESSGVKGAEDEAMPKRLYRNIYNRVFGGVCSGIAARFGIDPVIVRLVFVLLFFSGFITNGAMFAATALIYIILWFIIPPARTIEDKCRMYGRPIELVQFRNSVKEVSSEAVSSPALHTFGRIMLAVTGIIMMIIGLSGLLGSTVLTSMPQIIGRQVSEHILEYGPISPSSDGLGYFTSILFSENITWWMITAIAGLFSVWMLYNGVLLTFGFKAPKWKPGILLFILWILSILVFAGFIINRLVSISLTV